MNAPSNTAEATDRLAMVEVIDELQRRGIQWPCYGCRVAALASDEPKETCSHAELIGAVTYESALRTLRVSDAPNTPVVSDAP